MFAQFGKKAVYASVRPAAVHLISKNKHKINSALVFNFTNGVTCFEIPHAPEMFWKVKW